MDSVAIAVVGAGLIGRTHIELVREHPACRLAAIIDPDPAAGYLAEQAGVPRYASLVEAFSVSRPDGAVVATPNTTHVDCAMECVTAGVPVLVEKPIADNVADAERLVTVASAAGVPLLVGHHRRHSPVLATAREIVAHGTLGDPVTLMGSAMFYKPDGYFEAAPWRREPGGGPILINMIHEVDALRALYGEIAEVQATASTSTRGFAVEDTVAISLRFASGALGTFLLSDTAASVRSWEQTSGENPGYAHAGDEDCYILTGTRGSLAIPTMRLTTYQRRPGWTEPFHTTAVEVPRRDPLRAQLDHFHAVLRAGTPPLVTGRDGVRTLRATQAIAEAARTGAPVPIPGTAEQADHSQQGAQEEPAWP
ncbi:Gfo/Idh/MocA family oxidoreductase [Haloechinothrix sp. YIM 98757]|uniref:Gfo/Idh/MocA family oxidoreductase n=2 Tax=Haloechinothrix aidingensis TaxID=2752311 RepID=A0A838A8P9_9PSEU|nr:Gfo/Idh/MocA family oxidoreductase [Haloechinothrix aidingensis]